MSSSVLLRPSFIAGLSTIVLRILSFVFLRWIPGHPFPPLLTSIFIVYATSYYFCCRVADNSVNSDRTQLSSQSTAPPETSGSSEDGSLESDDETVNEKTTVQIEKVNGKVSRRVERGKKDTSGAEGKESGNNDLQSQDVLKILFLGLPDGRAVALSFMTALVNLCLFLMVADLTLRAPLFYPSNDLSFARVGYVDDSSARILVREPDPEQLPVFVSYRSDAIQAWIHAETIYLTTEDNDFTHALSIPKLRHSTKYAYSTSNGHTGTFRTAPPVGQLRKDTSRFTFLTSSCLKPRFPYNPSKHPLYIHGLEYLATLAPRLQASFMLFLGDFIYIDVPFRFGYGSQTYREEYRRVYNSPSWKLAGQDLPWLHVIDDHEIANDWDKGWEKPYPAAIDPFTIYHHSVNPTPLAQNTTYYSFKQGPASFFLLDSRRYRSREFELPNDHAQKSMLGSAQLASVLEWLRQPEPHGVNWKVMVSSVPFTRNWRVNAQDTWAGYLSERQMILEAMWDAASSARGYGVIILSGDRHEFSATRFPAPDENEAMRLAREFGSGEPRWRPGAAAYEFSVSPASMFYLPVRSYWEVPGESSGVGVGGEDQIIAYLPDGNSKFGAVEIENTVGSKQSILRYRLFVDGEESWSYVLTSGEEKGAAGKEAVWG